MEKGEGIERHTSEVVTATAMKSEAPKSTVEPPEAPASPTLLFQSSVLRFFSVVDVHESSIALDNIHRSLDEIGALRAPISDLRRFSVFLRLIRAADHELEAATRPHERRQPLSEREALPAA